MGNTSEDPIDHSRTTRQHAGETLKNGTNLPGLACVVFGVVAMVIGLAAFATGNPRTGSLAIVIAVVLAIVGGTWLFLIHRRVRRAELRWAAEHSADIPPPTS